MNRATRALLAATFLTGCTSPSTQVMVIVDGDAAVRARTTSLSVSIVGANGPEYEATYEGADLFWPREIAVVPRNGDANRTFEVTVTARDGSGATVVEQRAGTGFIPGRNLVLRVRLEQSCEGMTCGDEETCRSGACAAVFIAPETLPDYSSRDAGTGTLGDGGLRCSPDLSAPLNGTIDRTQGVIGDVARYTCNSSFVLTGNNSSTTRMCQPDGTWTGSDPICSPVIGPCSPNPCLNGGTCTLDGDNFTCSCTGTGYEGATCTMPIVCTGATAPEHGMVSGSAVAFPGVVTYTCDVGYVRVGNEFSRCGTDGMFDPPPTCEPGPCAPSLVAPTNGAVDVTEGVLDDVATYSCNVGYSLSGTATRTCLSSGTWSGTAPTCLGDLCAMGLSAPANGTVDRTNGVTGEVATYGCNAGYKVVGLATTTCQPDGTWSGTPPTCTPAWRIVSSGHPRLFGVWARTPSDVWAVGEMGTTLHFDGSDWTPVSTGDTRVLFAVWGTAANDVWAVGQGILHWDGSSWSVVEASGSYERVWGSSANDVWAVGTGSTVRHWDGVSWSPVTSGVTGLYGVSGLSATEAWAVGSGVAVRWNGVNWTNPGSLGSGTFFAIWEQAPNNVYVVGQQVRRWDGASWTTVTGPPSGFWFGVWGTSANDVWLTGDSGRLAHWDGTAWVNVPSPVSGSGGVIVDDVWGTSATDIWAITGNGQVLHYEP